MALLTSEENKNFSLLIARPELQVSQLPADETGFVFISKPKLPSFRTVPGLESELEGASHPGRVIELPVV